MNNSGHLKNIVKKIYKKLSTTKVSAALSSNFIKIGDKNTEYIHQSLLRNYFSDYSEEYMSSDLSKKDLHDHLFQRLNNDRNIIIPWLNHAKPLAEANILEIGCGTGCSTIALCEQGATVVGIDVNEKALKVARDRCKAYKLEAEFVNANVTEVKKLFKDRHFDFIIFYASLEHMTHEERMTAMRDTWEMLSPDDLWCIIETPNRLWYKDDHTSWLPFFNWLPDELAFHYTRYSPRPHFNDIFNDYTEKSRIDFLRLGRGVSYHEFDLTMKSADRLNIVSSMSTYYRNRNILKYIKWKLSVESRYESLLARNNPKIHRGFFQPDLDIIIKKD